MSASKRMKTISLDKFQECVRKLKEKHYFYNHLYIDDEKVQYTDLIYKPYRVIESVDKYSEDYFDDYERFISKKSQVKNQLFKVINFLKTEKVIVAPYNTEERIDSINNAIKIYLNYIYNKGEPGPLQDKCLIVEDV